VTVSLAIAGPQDTVGAGIDTLVSIESLAGSDYGDSLTGNGGTNLLDGLGGNDTLDGGGGADQLTGGAGDDTYLVDNAGDKVIEKLNRGTDTVSTTLSSYTLTADVENLVYAGTGDFTGTGNALANALTGGTGDDTLIGRQGGDALDGGLGTDVASYATAKTGLVASLANPASNTGDAAGDTYASIEGVRGSKYADALGGDDGDNLLWGGGGQDTLSGGLGGDTFAFDQTLVSGNVATVTDFAVGSDVIQLSLTIFAAAGFAGTLSASAFHTGSAAHDADDRIIYNGATGGLMFDADGIGGGSAKTFANVGTGLALSNTDLRLV
jgi:serralysin